MYIHINGKKYTRIVKVQMHTIIISRCTNMGKKCSKSRTRGCPIYIKGDIAIYPAWAKA
jgi:hypothetical protein